MRWPSIYETKLLIVIQFLISAFLGIEHVLMYDGFSFDLIGHETYSILLFISGSIMAYINYYR